MGNKASRPLWAVILLLTFSWSVAVPAWADVTKEMSDDFGEKLGQGSYGTVRALRNDPESVVKISNFSWKDPNALVNLREAIILSYLDHPRILKPKAITWKTVEGKQSLLMYLPRAQSLNKLNPALIRAMIEPLAYLHGLNMAHGDLKPAHFLQVKNQLVLVDFGSCDLDVSRPANYNKTTQHYRSPENLFGNYTYPRELDIWSLAISILDQEGFARQIPLIFNRYSEADVNDRMIYAVIKSFGIANKDLGLFRSYLSTKSQLRFFDAAAHTSLYYPIKEYPHQPLAELFPTFEETKIHLLAHMLDFNPQSRFTAKQLLRHPYLLSSHAMLGNREIYLAPPQQTQQEETSSDRAFLAEEFAMISAICESLKLDDFIFFESADLFAQLTEGKNPASLTKQQLNLLENSAIFLALIIYNEVNTATAFLNHQVNATLNRQELLDTCEHFLMAKNFKVLRDHAFRQASRSGMTRKASAESASASLKQLVIKYGDVNISL